MGHIDAHCHLADPRLQDDLEAIIQRARSHGITGFLQGGVGPEDWERQKALQKRYPESIFPCFGLHPWWVAENEDPVIDQGLDHLSRQLGPGIALGELGLDHARRGGDEDARGRQLRAFRAQLELGLSSDAARGSRPLVLHIVRAHPQALNILKEYRGRGLRGIVHSFNGSYEVASAYLDLGLTLSLGGSAARKEGFETFKRAVVRIPPDAFVLETDSPDQRPEGWPGELNEPSSLLRIAQAVGELRGEDPGAILDRSRIILQRIFELPDGT